jgi:hypothetical protein
MTNLAKLAGLASAAVLALSLAACDRETPADKQVEAQAEALVVAYAADAEMTEAYAKGTPAEAQAEAQADALREKGDAVQDKLRKEADELGEDTKDMPKADQPKP